MNEPVVKQIPLSNLYHNPNNPRRKIGDVTELADSIASMGILQNMTVVPYDPSIHCGLTVADPANAYIILIGNRRFEGGKKAKIATAPCVIMEGLTASDQMGIMLVENNQREDLTYTEQAYGFQYMLDMGESVESVAQKTGFSSVTVRNRIRLCDLDREKVDQAAQRGATLSDYMKLFKIQDPELRNSVLDTIGTPNFNYSLKDAKLPLIVWLHGSGEKSVDVDTFLSNGLPAVLNDWNLHGFNAYVLCPHLTGSWNAGAWCLPQSKDALSDLLDLIVTQYNIDEDKVIITGHSLGGQGALYMAAKMPDRFSAVVVLSGYNPISKYDRDVDISTITIPVIGFVGTVSAGEDQVSYRFMVNGFANAFGIDNTYVINCSHGKVPQKAFCQDNNGNGMSDLLEWIHERAIK